MLPAFHDPFAGGGALPLEAQRLGLEAYASDLNPVAVLINKAMIEIPPKFAGRPPVNSGWRKNSKQEQALTQWKGAKGLAEDVRYYGQWMRDEAEKRIGHGTANLDATRAGRDASRIADEVLSHLVSQVGAEVTVTIEIEAKLPQGASDQLVRTVTENSRTLKFTSHGFEKD